MLVSIFGDGVIAKHVSRIVVDSAHANENSFKQYTTRLTVESDEANIEEIEFTTSATILIIDDICTDAKPTCRPLAGRNNGPSFDRFDLVFLRDDEYSGTDAEYEAFVNELIDKNLLAAAPLVGQEALFNFYVSDERGDTDWNPKTLSHTCGQGILPDGFLAGCPFADAIAVLYNTDPPVGDCSHSGVFSAGNWAGFIHEVGHSPLDLDDEYDDYPECWTFRPESDTNVYTKEASCQQDAVAHGIQSSLCRKLTDCRGGYWMITDEATGGSGYIMEYGENLNRGWGYAATWRLQEAFEKLKKGEWVGDSDSDATPSRSKSIMIWLTLDREDGLKLTKTMYKAAPSPQYLRSSSVLSVSIYDDQDELLGRIGMGDPLTVSGDVPPLDSTDYIMRIPYYMDVVYAIIEYGDFSLSVDLASLAGIPSNVVADAGGPYSGNEGETISLNASLSKPVDDITQYDWDVGSTGKFCCKSLYDAFVRGEKFFDIRCFIPFQA